MSGARETISGPSRWLRWAHEYMFALNLVWIIVWIERVTSKNLGGHFIQHYVFVLGRGAAGFAYISDFTIIEQLIWSFTLATFVFLVLRLLSGFAATDLAMRTAAGVAAIAVYPIATLYTGLLTGNDCCAASYKIRYALEVMIVLTCGILFYLKNRRISVPLMIVALALHFSIWAWITSSYFNILEFFNAQRTAFYHPSWSRVLASLGVNIVFTFGFPVFGFLASLTWVRYVRRAPQGRAATT